MPRAIASRSRNPDVGRQARTRPGDFVTVTICCTDEMVTLFDAGSNDDADRLIWLMRTGWIRLLSGRRVWVGLMLLCLAGCASAPPPAPPPIEAGPVDAKRLVAVLVAGDETPAAFDNAIAYMADELTAAGVPPAQIHRLSASRAGRRRFSPRPRTRCSTACRASKRRAAAAAWSIPTSHGAYQHGLYLVLDNTLMPTELDRVLELGCGEAPTVVIVSACFAGQFTLP